MDNVVSIFSKAEEKEKEEKAKVEEVFAETMKKNKENAERVKKQRTRDNQNVTRSYRLKPKA